MISKIVSSSTGVFRCLVKPYLFCASDVGFRSDRGLNRQVLTAQGLTDFRSVTQFLQQKKELSLTDLNLITQKLISIRNIITPGENLGLINFKLKQLDYSTLDLDTMSNICGVVPILNQHQSFNWRCYQAISNKITQFLQQPNKLSDENLIRFMETLSDADKNKELFAVLQLFKDRIPQLKFKDYQKYLNFVNKRKLPTKLEKSIFNVFMAKLEDQVQKIDMRTTINMFKYLKNLNGNIYQSHKVVSALQEKISQNIDDLEQNEVMSLLDLQYNNKFSKLIFKKAMDSIQENGESQISIQTIFKVLNKLTQSGDFKIFSADKETKFLRFLGKNLDKTFYIMQLIKKNFFTKNQLINLNKVIVENDAQWYLNSFSYLYEIAIRGIAQPSSFTAYFQSLKNENPSPFFGDKYISSILILDKASAISKEGLSPQVKQLKDNLIKGLEHFKTPINIKNPNAFRKNKMLEIFSKKYGYLFVNSLIEKVTKDNEKLNNVVFNFLIASNDFRNLFKLLKHNKLTILPLHQKYLLQKVTHNPIFFKGNFEIINRLFLELEQFKGDVIKKLTIYVCSWQVHNCLNPEEVTSFLKLAQLLLKKNHIKTYALNDYVSYFFRSPSHLIKNSTQYLNFLHEIQTKKQLIIRNPVQAQQQKDDNKPESQTQPSEKSSRKNNYTTKSQIVPLVQSALQFCKYNVLQLAFAEKILQKENLRDYLKNYINIVRGQKFDKNQIPIVPQNMHIIVRSKTFEQSQLEPLMPQIRQTIQKLTVNQAQYSIFNFQMRWNRSTSQIFKLLLKRYTQIVKQGRDLLKVQLVLKHMHQLHQNSSEYKELLEALTQYSSKNFSKIPLSGHYLLLQQCTDLGVDSAKQFSQKLLGNMQGKLNKYQLNSSSFEHVLFYALLHDEQAAFKLLNQLIKTENNFFLIKKFAKLLNLVDPTNQKFLNLFKKILDYQKQPLEIQEGIFRYLVTLNKNYSQIQSKIKLVPAKEPFWLIQKLIKYSEKNNVPVQKIEKYGHKYLIIGGKNIFFSQQNFSYLVDERLRKYFSVLLGVSDQKEQNLIIYMKQFKPHHLGYVLSQEIPQFKDKKSQLARFIYQKKQNNENVKADQKDQNQTQTKSAALQKKDNQAKPQGQKSRSNVKNQSKQQRKQQKDSKDSKDSWQK